MIHWDWTGLKQGKDLTLWLCQNSYWKWSIEIADLPIKNGGSLFHSYVTYVPLPEGNQLILKAGWYLKRSEDSQDCCWNPLAWLMVSTCFTASLCSLNSSWGFPGFEQILQVKGQFCGVVPAFMDGSWWFTQSKWWLPIGWITLWWTNIAMENHHF